MQSTGWLNQEWGAESRVGGWIKSTGLDQEWGAESRVGG